MLQSPTDGGPASVSEVCREHVTLCELRPAELIPKDDLALESDYGDTEDGDGKLQASLWGAGLR